MHDYEDFPNMGDNPSLSDMSELAERINEHGNARLAHEGISDYKPAEMAGLCITPNESSCRN